MKRSFNDVTCLKLNFCFKKIKEKLVTKIWTVYFHSPRFGFNYGFKTELYSVPFPDLWKGFFCVCLIRPIFLKNILSSLNWSTLLSDLMASSIRELAVGWTSSVGCTQNVVNLYTSCHGPSPKSTIECSTLWRKVKTPRGYTWGRSTKATTEFKTLWRKVTTLRGYTRRRSMRSTTEWGFLSTEQLSGNGGQTIERSWRAMYFWGLRGGSTGSLLCNAIRRPRRRKRKTKRFWFVTNKRWRFPIRVVHFQSYSIEGQSVSCIAGKCVSAN